jgi:hypothetical protein
VFTVLENGNIQNIYMATWNVATQQLGTPIPLTNDPGSAFQKNQHPAWCGSGSVVWSRYTSPVTLEQEPDVNEYTICIMKVDENGPIPGTIKCHDTPEPDSDDGGDELDEEHPSCGVFNGQEKIAYANGKVGAGDLDTYKICIINSDFSGEEECTPDDNPTIDQTMPTWSPGGTQLAFASNESGGDYDIFVINVPGLPNNSWMMLGPDDAFEDLDPDWGPAVLGP